MKASKLREMSIEELEKEREELSKQLFQLRLQEATGQLDNVSKIRQIRRDRARVNTILTEKERQQ
ncbi:MAG TPA: 50S ribosomal protein L29 [Acidobacteriota bacterium]|nr:50S ribosomal protein L29 [Acidobacteriota bacterium]